MPRHADVRPAAARGPSHPQTKAKGCASLMQVCKDLIQRSMANNWDQAYEEVRCLASYPPKDKVAASARTVWC